MRVARQLRPESRNAARTRSTRRRRVAPCEAPSLYGSSGRCSSCDFAVHRAPRVARRQRQAPRRRSSTSPGSTTSAGPDACTTDGRCVRPALLRPPGPCPELSGTLLSYEPRDELRESWFVVNTDCTADMKGVLLAERTGPSQWRGYWSFGADHVDEISAYLRKRYSPRHRRTVRALRLPSTLHNVSLGLPMSDVGISVHNGWVTDMCGTASRNSKRASETGSVGRGTDRRTRRMKVRIRELEPASMRTTDSALTSPTRRHRPPPRRRPTHLTRGYQRD